jgi:hypothetical protein
MAEKEQLNDVPTRGFTAAVIEDVYASGITSLQTEYIKNGLSRFKAFSPGIYKLQDSINEQETDRETGNQTDTGSDTSESSHNSSHSNSGVDN